MRQNLLNFEPKPYTGPVIGRLDVLVEAGFAASHKSLESDTDPEEQI